MSTTSTKNWWDTFYTYVWIFNTGRGLSVCIRLPHNVGIIYDLGSSDEFSPADFITEHIAPELAKYERSSIAQCVMSHPHADHIMEVDATIERDGTKPPLYPRLLTCPNDICPGEEVDFDRIKTDDNAELISAYRASYDGREPPLQTIQDKVSCNVPNVEYGLYYMVPPGVGAIHENDDQLYGNGLSIVLYLRHGNQSILIPGDITPEVLERVLLGEKSVERRYTYFSGGPDDIPFDLFERTSEQPILAELLSKHGLSVLVTPHHGLESCYSEDLFEMIDGNKPLVNVISDKRHLSDSDGQVDQRYQSEDGAVGLKVDVEGRIEDRYSVSTRDGHHILIVFKGSDRLPHIYLRKDPEDLLEATI